MNRVDRPTQDWNPLSDEVSNDQRAVYDAMRERCPVAHSDELGWSVFRHEDVVQVIQDHETFSNRVSRHLAVPNGMDPPEHTAYRDVIVPYFSEERMRLFEPVCREIVAGLVEDLRARGSAEFIGEFALIAAVQLHTSFVGWPTASHEFLIEWITKSNEATHARDRQAQAASAREFERFVGEMLSERRLAGTAQAQDVTASLMQEVVLGRPLNDAEVTSILRNWTAGEIGTSSAAFGIVVHYLIRHPELQEQLRREPTLLTQAIDEILRIHGPLIANRRVTTRAVELGGRTIEANEPISLNWMSANRDERVFEDPDAFRLTRDPGDNLLYGAGIHVCPGAPFARLELRVTLEELLSRTAGIELDPDDEPTLAVYPASGYATLPVRVV